MANAGSVFLGPWTPETMGDYCSGTNHVLPTYGFARAYSGLGLADLLKRITVQELSAEGLRALGPTAVTLAELEGLDAHARAVTLRLESLAQGRASEQRARARAADLLALAPYSMPRGSRASSACTPTNCRGARSGDHSAAGLNRYPEPQPAALLRRLGELYGVDRAQLLVGRGSDEAIDLLVRAFCRAGEDSILDLSADLRHVRGGRADPGRGHRAGAAARERGLRARRAPACSTPGGPGQAGVPVLAEQSHRQRRAGARPAGAVRGPAGRALVVVDEAYMEFCGRDSIARHRDAFPHLAVLRTLSKAHALAGARCGTLIAHPRNHRAAATVIPPYAVPSPVSELVLAMLLARGHRAMARTRVETLLKERERLCARLAQLPPSCASGRSDANFLLVRCIDAQRVLDAALRGAPADSRRARAAGLRALRAHQRRHARAERPADRRARGSDAESAP